MKASDSDDYGEYEISDDAEARVSRTPVSHVVEIIQMKFVPDVLNINEGDSVIWVNKDMVQHDVTALNTNRWSSSPMTTGASWKMVFKDSQVYHCSLHVVMKGKIIVDGNDIAMDVSEVTLCGGGSEASQTNALN